MLSLAWRPSSAFAAPLSSSSATFGIMEAFNVTNRCRVHPSTPPGKISAQETMTMKAIMRYAPRSLSACVSLRVSVCLSVSPARAAKGRESGGVNNVCVVCVQNFSALHVTRENFTNPRNFFTGVHGPQADNRTFCAWLPQGVAMPEIAPGLNQAHVVGTEGWKQHLSRLLCCSVRVAVRAIG